MSLNLIGGIVFETGKLREAEFYFHEALDLARKFDDQVMVARISNNLASVADIRGDTGLAHRLFASLRPVGAGSNRCTRSWQRPLGGGVHRGERMRAQAAGAHRGCRANLDPGRRALPDHGGRPADRAVRARLVEGGIVPAHDRFNTACPEFSRLAQTKEQRWQ